MLITKEEIDILKQEIQEKADELAVRERRNGYQFHRTRRTCGTAGIVSEIGIMEHLGKVQKTCPHSGILNRYELILNLMNAFRLYPEDAAKQILRAKDDGFLRDGTEEWLLEYNFSPGDKPKDGDK